MNGKFSLESHSIDITALLENCPLSWNSIRELFFVSPLWTNQINLKAEDSRLLFQWLVNASPFFVSFPASVEGKVSSWISHSSCPRFTRRTPAWFSPTSTVPTRTRRTPPTSWGSSPSRTTGTTSGSSSSWCSITTRSVLLGGVKVLHCDHDKSAAGDYK